MSFVGVIAANKDFESIKQIIYKKVKDKTNAIKITENNIENMKNIKYDTIVIGKEISDFKEKEEILKQIINNAKYLIINTDVNIDKEIFGNVKTNIITYGLNGKATLTVSSIGEDDIMLCLQRSIEDFENNIIEPYEVNIKNKEINNKKIYILLTAYAILTIYNGNIISNI